MKDSHPAYFYPLSFVARNLKWPIHSRFCSSCGETTGVLDVDIDRWDRLCAPCRSWSHGVLNWILSFWGKGIRHRSKKLRKIPEQQALAS